MSLFSFFFFCFLSGILSLSGIVNSFGGFWFCALGFDIVFFRIILWSSVSSISGGLWNVCTLRRNGCEPSERIKRGSKLFVFLPFLLFLFCYCLVCLSPDGNLIFFSLSISGFSNSQSSLPVFLTVFTL